MSYSDNLFTPKDDSGDNPEGDNGYDLSPTDGYFNSNQIPRDIISGPTIPQQDTSKSRAINEHSPDGSEISSTRQVSLHTNASDHAAEHSRISSHSIHSPSYHQQDSSSTPNHTFFDQPPPAYIVSAEASPVSAQERHTPTSYNTFLQNQAEGGLSRDPQSMGGSAGDPNMDKRTPLWLNRASKKESFRREIITKILGIGLPLVIVAALLSAIFVRKLNPNSDMGRPRLPGPIHNGGPHCRHTSKLEQTTFEIPKASGLVILQDFYKFDIPHYGQEVITTGEARVRNLPNDFPGLKSHFTVDVKLSHPELSVIKTFNEEDGSLKISTPRFAWVGTHERPCISIEITAWIVDGAEISNVYFDLMTLSIRLFDDTKIKTIDDTTLKTVSGTIHFPKHISTDHASMVASEVQSQNTYELNSRRIALETISGNIEGIYPLYDLLKISSQSGMISVDIYPKPLLNSAPAPATLDIQTSSGRIEVRSPVKLPEAAYPREYITTVESLSGAIQGDFFVSSTGRFNTTSSRIQLVVKPVLTTVDEKRNELSTYSLSGSTHVTLLDPLFVVSNIVDHTQDSMAIPSLTIESSPSIQRFESKLRTFHSIHKTTSGRIEAYYPSSWIGNIDAKTISGRIEMDGKGIKIVERNDGWGFKKIKARKGVARDEDGGSIGLQTVNGRIRLEIHD